MNKYEFLVLFWVGIPLWLIAITFVMLLIRIKESMCF